MFLYDIDRPTLAVLIHSSSIFLVHTHILSRRVDAQPIELPDWGLTKVGIGEQFNQRVLPARHQVHFGFHSTHISDLESLGYMALYSLPGSLHGSLPWLGLKAPTRQEKYRLVFERKKTIKVAELCYGRGSEFATYMSYIREMSDQEKPDYKYPRS